MVTLLKNGLPGMLVAWLGLFGYVSLAHAEGRIEAEAIAGQPFGVGRIVLDLTPSMLPDPLGVEGIGLVEKSGRVLYPCMDTPAAGKLLREILNRNTPLTSGGPVRRQVGGILRGVLDRPPRTTIYFLFHGSEPLDLMLQTRGETALKVVPRNDPIAHRLLLDLWWQQYAKPAGLFDPKPDYPPMVENFLMTTLARRLNLPIPKEKQTEPAYAELRKEIGLNLGTESVRVAMEQDRILGLHNLGLPAEEALPKPVEAPPLVVSEAPADVKSEPIAMHVPPECFYVRFGSFANFLWLQDTLAKWGGDAQNLVALRGLDHDMSGRMERQLILKQTILSRMLGDTVIADVAIIGTDMFFREGAAYGLLFQARNNLALATSFGQQRQERLKAGDASETKLQIQGHEVSYISSPDGKVRSYYVVDGDYHFFTTSKALVVAFLASSGEKSLGATKEFRHARSLMPLDRNDTVWVYASDAFFRNMTSPHYRIEMARRLQAVADIELVQLAKLASASESRPNATIEELKSSGWLPADFGPLPDGSRTVLERGEAYDSVRGHRGAFVPIPDMPVDKITKSELSEYQKFADYYQATWGRIDPIIVGMKRNAQKDNVEQVVVDVLMSPFAPQHFARLQEHLGPADSKQLAPVAGNMASIELVLKDQRVFGGLRDIGSPADASMASFLPVGRLRDFVIGYLGTTGQLGVLNVLNIGIPPGSDAAGYAMSPIGGWRRQFGEFTLFSFQREVLEEVAPQLQFESAKRTAQIRLHVEDVSQARVTPALNDLAYTRTRETSLGNLRLLHALDQQLHVPPSACKEAAEFLLDAKLICPLGGEYVLRENAGQPPRWISTAIGPVESAGLLRVRAPEGYRAPPLSWFRGLDLDASMTEKSISAHAEILMLMPAKK